MIVIQAVTTRWTKASRGAPQAGVRAGVPAAATLPVPLRAGAAGGALVHQLEALEERGFTLDEVAVDDEAAPPVTVAGVRVAQQGDLVEVTRLGARWQGWPPRERDRVVFRLAPGEWGRAVRNLRIGGAGDWRYAKFAVNVAHLSDPVTFDPDLFVAAPPTYEVNEEAQLR